MSILGRAYSPIMSNLGEAQGLLGASALPRMPQRPNLPQATVRPPNYEELARQNRAASAGGGGSGIGQILGLVGGIIAAIPSGGTSLLPTIGAGIGAAGTAAGIAGV